MMPTVHEGARQGANVLQATRLTEDLAPVPAATNLAVAEEEKLAVGIPTASTDHRLLLSYAVNPFDHQDLFLRGFKEWGRGLDARISGRRLPDKRLLGLFATGFGSGALRLLLIGPNLSRLSEGHPASEPEAVTRPWHRNVERDCLEERHGDRLSRPSIAQVIGFDVLSCMDRFAQGHLLFLQPEYRGHGLCGAYFDAVLDLARRQGLRGFQFLSTLPKWSKGEYPFERSLHLKQGNGTEVWRYRRMA